MVMLEFFAGPHQAGAVEDDNQRAGYVQNGRPYRGQESKCRDGQSHNDEANAEGEILVDDSPGAAGKLHEKWHRNWRSRD